MLRILISSLFILGVSASSLAQNGKLISKVLVDLKHESVWENISSNDTLLSDYKHVELLNFYQIEYWSDSLIINGIYVEPKSEGKYPVVIFNRGGNGTFGSISVEMIAQYTGKLAAEGYIILASNYRADDEFGGKDLNDILNIIESAKYFDKADTNKIGMFGWSRGGMMTYLALKHSSKIKAAIVGNGPTNLFSTIQDRPSFETVVLEKCIPNYDVNKIQELEKRSVIFWTDELFKETQLLMLNGTNDKRLDYNQSVELAEKLTLINYPFELKLFETDHYFSDKKVELNQIVINWFNNYLK